MEKIILIHFIVIVTAHFVGDFILQNDWMAKGKSKRFLPLVSHVFVYSVAVSCILFAAAVIPVSAILAFFAVNAILHLATDYVSSRISSKFFAKGETHNAFVVIGTDQLFHYYALFATYYYFGAHSL